MLAMAFAIARTFAAALKGDPPSHLVIILTLISTPRKYVVLFAFRKKLKKTIMSIILKKYEYSEPTQSKKKPRSVHKAYFHPLPLTITLIFWATNEHHMKSSLSWVAFCVIKRAAKWAKGWQTTWQPPWVYMPPNHYGDFQDQSSSPQGKETSREKKIPHCDRCANVVLADPDTGGDYHIWLPYKFNRQVLRPEDQLRMFTDTRKSTTSNNPQILMGVGKHVVIGMNGKKTISPTHQKDQIIPT